MTAALTTTARTRREAVGAAIGALPRAPATSSCSPATSGAGKTTFAQGLAARARRRREPVTSPTFTIVQEYDGRCRVAHVDVYRLERIQELHDLGFEELLDGPRSRSSSGARSSRRPAARPHRRAARDRRRRRRRRGCSRSSRSGPSWARAAGRSSTARSPRLGAALMLLLGIDTVDAPGRRRARRTSTACSGRVELGGTRRHGPPRHAETLAPAIAWCCEQCGVDARAALGDRGRHRPGHVHRTARRRHDREGAGAVAAHPGDPDPEPRPARVPAALHARGSSSPTIDARRHELYWAIYRPVPGGVQRVSEYELGTPDDLVAELEARGEDAFVCGDGALRFRGRVRAARAPRRARRARRTRRRAWPRWPSSRPARYEREEFCARRRRAADVPAAERRRARVGPEGRREWRPHASSSSRSRCTSSPMRRRHLRGVAAHRGAGVPAAVDARRCSSASSRCVRRARTSSPRSAATSSATAGLMMSLDRRARHHDRGRPGVAPPRRSGPGCCSRSRAKRSTRGATALTLEVRLSNRGAQELYQRFGFTPVGVRKGYYADTGEDALIMWAYEVERARRTRALLDGLERSVPRHDGRRAHRRVGDVTRCASSGSRRRATRPRPRSSTTAATCARRSSRARPICTRATAASCPRSRAARTSS